ncbi:MAG: type IVB secretion system protein IcmH/DotU [Methylococcaceae bacterium]|nr:type IVB secretion system protein IcmH/DotU [Methylococcaceae bacterium]
MNKDDPFGHYFDDDNDDDKTIIRPSPKGQKVKPPEFIPNVATKIPDELTSYPSNNPLTSSAQSLLLMVVQLRNTRSHPDIAGLRQSVINEIKLFETKINQQGVSAEQHQAARYALCALFDETVLNTTWGCNSLWGTQSLLITFHKEAWGGEKFFLILKHCLQQAQAQLPLLELLYFCLCLGFEGKYRIQDNGRSQLEEIRENCYRVIQQHRGNTEKDLSIHWQGIDDDQHILIESMPLWRIAVISAVLLVLIFLGFWFVINTKADPLMAKLQGINKGFISPPTETKTAVAPAPPVFDHINGFLEPEIKAGQVTVEQRNGKTIVRIMSKGFFASGSDKVMVQYEPLLNKIAQALTEVSGLITVVGHTDNTPMVGRRFPSNWELSKARAQAVANALMANPKLSATVVSEGRADTQPMVANDTPEHRAMNRRVEIIF